MVIRIFITYKGLLTERNILNKSILRTLNNLVTKVKL